MEHIYNICWLLLAQQQVGQAPVEAGSAAGAAPAADPGFFGLGYMFPALMAVMLLYFIMTAKPQPKGAERTSELLANLKKNDRVVTAGGILGTVVNYRSDSEYVTLRVDDSSNTRMQILATSIIRVVSDETTA